MSSSMFLISISSSIPTKDFWIFFNRLSTNVIISDIISSRFLCFIKQAIQRTQLSFPYIVCSSWLLPPEPLFKNPGSLCKSLGNVSKLCFRQWLCVSKGILCLSQSLGGRKHFWQNFSQMFLIEFSLIKRNTIW